MDLSVPPGDPHHPADPPSDHAAQAPHRGIYIPVRAKFAIAFAISIAWLCISTWLALPWLRDLAALSNWAIAVFAVGGIAILPGFMNAFLISSLMMDRRPSRKALAVYPGVTILIAAYNEAGSIAETIESIERQQYPGPFEVMVIDDGSSDGTADLVALSSYPWLTLLRQPENAGKSAALNRGLALARHELVITLDADSYLFAGAIQHLVERYRADPDHTRAVAGSTLVRNSRKNWVTKIQEWDYFHGAGAWAMQRTPSASPTPRRSWGSFCASASAGRAG